MPGRTLNRPAGSRNRARLDRGPPKKSEPATGTCLSQTVTSTSSDFSVGSRNRATFARRPSRLRCPESDSESARILCTFGLEQHSKRILYAERHINMAPWIVDARQKELEKLWKSGKEGNLSPMEALRAWALPGINLAPVPVSNWHPGRHSGPGRWEYQ